VYVAVNRQLCLGRLRNWNQLADLSSHFHIPVPFLKDNQLVKLGDDGIVFQAQGFVLANLHDAVEEYRLILDECVSNLLAIIEKDRE
jgi:hypothetical protein